MDGHRRSDEEIQQLVAEFTRQSRRSTRIAVALAMVGSLLLGAFLLYVVERYTGAITYDDIYAGDFSLVLDDQAVKKSVAETLPGGSETAGQPTDAVAPAIRAASNAEVASLVAGAGADQSLLALTADSPTPWNDYVRAQGRTGRFALAMTTLRSLGLVTFEGTDAQGAVPTSRGRDVATYLEQARVQQAPEASRLPSRGAPPASVPSLAVNQRALEGVFESYADNWYVATITRPALYIIETTAPGQGFGVDTVVRLYDEDGTTLLGEDDDGGNGTYSLLREELDPGSYYLRVSSYRGVAGGYRVAIDEGLLTRPQPQEAVFDGEGIPLMPGPPQAGQVEGTAGTWYRVQVTASGLYTFETSAPESSTGVDTVLRLYAADRMTLLGDDDDGGQDTYSLLREDLAAGVTYYLGVTSFWDEPGAFRIQLRPATPEQAALQAAPASAR